MLNTDSVSQLNIDRAQVEKGTATKISDGVNSLKAYDATEDGTGAVGSNSADYGRNNTSTGNNTDEVATAQLGGSYAAGSRQQLLLLQHQRLQISLKQPKSKLGLTCWVQILRRSEQLIL